MPRFFFYIILLLMIHFIINTELTKSDKLNAYYVYSDQSGHWVYEDSAKLIKTLKIIKKDSIMLYPHTSNKLSSIKLEGVQGMKFKIEDFVITSKRYSYTN